jgi:hypothetical protein
MIRGVSVYGSKKRKPKKKIDMAKMEIEWRQYNKRMRQANCHSAQFETVDDYVRYLTGKTKKVKQEFVPYEPKTTFRRTTQVIPSKSTDCIPGAAAQKERQVYSGDYIVGIACMHKSNFVPVGRGDDPKAYATMRRN